MHTSRIWSLPSADVESKHTRQHSLHGRHSIPLVAALALPALHTPVAMQVLTSKQEAMLDTIAYPWWPDLWMMAEIAGLAL